tara:strand:- start:2010 stop:2180 length:171 start_codon:yes stop_codon:yes gene_type:complete
MTQLHAREKPPIPLDRHGNPILLKKVEKVVEEDKIVPEVKAKAPAKKAAPKKKGKK